MLTAIYHMIAQKEPFVAPNKSKKISSSQEQILIAKLHALGYKVEKIA
jgi:hypothetical protein